MNDSNKIMIGLGVLIFISLMQTCSSCNNQRKTAALENKLDSLETVVATKNEVEDLKTDIKVEGLEISKRMLYDNNSIVRKTTRPDDRMVEYDAQIKELQKK